MDQLFHKIVNLTSGGGIIALAFVAIFWKLAFPMFTIMFFYALWWVFNFIDISLVPNLVLGLTLALCYGFLLLKDEIFIQANEMPDNWETYHIVLCVFVALQAACLTASSMFTIPWLPIMAYGCIMFAYVFLAIQFMLSTYFHVDG